MDAWMKVLDGWELVDGDTRPRCCEGWMAWSDCRPRDSIDEYILETEVFSRMMERGCCLVLCCRRRMDEINGLALDEWLLRRVRDKCHDGPLKQLLRRASGSRGRFRVDASFLTGAEDGLGESADCDLDDGSGRLCYGRWLISFPSRGQLSTCWTCDANPWYLVHLVPQEVRSFWGLSSVGIIAINFAFAFVTNPMAGLLREVCRGLLRELCVAHAAAAVELAVLLAFWTGMAALIMLEGGTSGFVMHNSWR